MESRNAATGASNAPALRPRLVLLHDDQRRAARLLQRLSTDSFDVASSPIATLDDDSLRALQPDVVLLDATAPENDLIRTCEQTRARTEKPLILLTPAKDERLVAKVLALGLDDYLAEPIGDLELVARVEATVRRAQRYGGVQGTQLVGSLALSYADHSVELHGRRIALSPMEFRLLACLASAPGHVLTHQTLMSRVWGAEYVDSRHYLRLYIRYLREKLEDDPTRPRLIVSEWGVGYRLELPESSESSPMRPAPAPA